MAVATRFWDPDDIVLTVGRSSQTTFDLYQADGVTPLVLTASDVVRFKAWLSGSEASAPAIDASSVASSATFTADAGTDVITSTSHGLSDNDAVYLTTTDTLPAGLSTNTIYYIINSAASTFQVATSEGGSAIDITDAGTGTHSWTQLKSTVTVDTVGSSGSTPATVTVNFDQEDTEDLTADGNYLGELAIVDQSDFGRIKPVQYGQIRVLASTGDQGAIGLT